MCYPKPGPRCSTHARKAYVKAYMAQIIYMKSSAIDPEEYIRIKENLASAEDDYRMTPSGLRDLQRRIDRGEDRNGYLSEQKKHYEKKRAEALAAVGARKQGKNKIQDTHKHSSDEKPAPALVTSNDFLADDQPREAWSADDAGLKKKINDYLDLSGDHIEKLSLDEHAAIRWFTSDGSGKSYHHLVEGQTLESQDAIHQTNLDAAFARHKAQESQVVYRGLNDHAFPEDYFYGKSEEEGRKALIKHLHERFVVGEDITIPHYSSATADPATAGRFTGMEQVIMEIKTPSTMAVGVVSAWEASEREMVIARDKTFKVVAIKENIPYAGSRTDEKYTPMTVIQLEEVLTKKVNIR